MVLCHQCSQCLLADHSPQSQPHHQPPDLHYSHGDCGRCCCCCLECTLQGWGPHLAAAAAAAAPSYLHWRRTDLLKHHTQPQSGTCQCSIAVAVGPSWPCSDVAPEWFVVGAVAPCWCLHSAAAVDPSCSH